MARYGVFRYGYDTFGLGEVSGDYEHSYVGHQFTPVVHNVWNQFDEFGLLASMPRIEGEANWEYKRRISDVFVHRANSTYRGLVNGITRELGLSLFCPINVNPRTDSSGNFLAPDPYIKFDGVWVYLYSDYKNGLLDYRIDRYALGGNFETLERLVDFINTTHYFTASLLIDSSSVRSMTIVNQSNRGKIIDQEVLPVGKFQLPHRYIIRNSISTNDRSVFKREVSSESNLNRLGDYYIDYRDGIISFYMAPSIGVTMSYDYIMYPFKPIASPVILHDINNDNFKVKMFNFLEGSDTYNLPTELGVDTINELISVHPMFWGV